MPLYKNSPHPAVITTAQAVPAYFTEHRKQFGNVPLVATSGAFDPCHIGHGKCIEGSALLKGPDGLLVVIVNDDGFLIRKKGYVFMPIQERLEMISRIRGVDLVIPWDDGSQMVTEAIKIIKPTIYAKGGDRSTAENVPEYDECIKVGCTVVFGIGGDTKIQSSSELIQKMQLPKEETMTK